MSIQNDYLKNRFTIRYNNAVNGVDLFKACIDMLEGIKDEEDLPSTVEAFLATLPSFAACNEDKEEVKHILDEYTSGKATKNETVAYFNYMHDTAYSKAHNMLLIQDIFKCYF